MIKLVVLFIVGYCIGSFLTHEYLAWKKEKDKDYDGWK
jgi:hypothetical protein